MNLLYALVAFSIIMIVASTLVVALVRLLHEFRRLRQRHMRYMLGAIFDEYLWPEFGRFAATLPQELTRRKTTEYSAINELKPARGWWYSLFAALDIWTIIWAAVNGDSKKRKTHDWQWGTFGAVSAALWLLILIIITICIYLQIFFPLFVLGIAIFFAIDWARELDRDRYAIWSDLEPGKADKLKELDAYRKTAGDAELSLDDLAGIESLAGESPEALAELLNDYQRLTRRRAFVDDILKVSKSMAANTGRAENSEIEQVSVVDFAAHLGRSEFGEAISRVAMAQKDKAEAGLADMTNTILDEISRRYDELSGQSSANFRDLARQWSVGLAFVVAFTANVDAPYLFTALYENPELSQKVEAKYGARVEAMSKLEAELVAEVTEAEAQAAGDGSDDPDQAAAEDSQKAVADLKAQLESVRGEFADTTGELASLGLPVGWDFFPFCQEIQGMSFASAASYSEIRDQRCSALARAVSEKNPDAPVTVTLSGLFGVQKAERSAAVTDATAPTFLSAYFATIADYARAAIRWVAIRLPHGLTLWVFGAVLGGALIGLGGPFWFDIYRRLSSIAQIAGAVGLTARGTRQAATGGTAQSEPPEVVHQPKDVYDAFNTARTVRAQLQLANAQNG